MSEGPPRTTENTADVSPEMQEGQVVDNIVFEAVEKRGAGNKYRSAAPDRKIMTLIRESQVLPEPGEPYTVRIIEDTDSSNPNAGTLYVEIIGSKKLGDLEKEANEFEMINAVNEASRAFASNDLEATIGELKRVKKLMNE